MSRLATVAFEVEDGGECGLVEVRRELGIASDELGEVALLVPGAHRVALDEPVGLVAFEPALDEREQQPVGEEEAVRGPEVPLHAIGVDDEARRRSR